MRIALMVNGVTHTPDIDPGESLMPVLRRLGYKSVKDGCDNGDCGSCTILLDGRAVNACLVFAASADHRTVTTVEGLADSDLHPVQQTMLDLGGIQCGFCTPGMVMLAIDLLHHTPSPTEAQVRDALAGNYCRCTGYVKQVEAILAAVQEPADG
jgi:aerobic-type carbon monoxide dehydrogenase small subunit (CoxS/CutS family)